MTLKQSGETYDRRMQLKSAGIDLSGVIAAVCPNFNIDEKRLACPTDLFKIAQTRVRVRHNATRDLSIPRSEVAR